MTPVWDKIERFDSSDLNVCKYVFTNARAVVEAVLYKYGSYEERTVVCCSVMSGCPIGCRFCGTGDYFVRNLTADEIVAQVEHLLCDKGIDASKIKRFQIMTMSMGEPLLNLRELGSAMRVLHNRYPTAALLISTSGPRADYASFRHLSIEVPKIGLQFSVHESTDAGRNTLIPFEAKLNLKEIAHEGELWFAMTRRKPFFNYCAHPLNVSIDDVKRLRAIFMPDCWECTISVICERGEHVAAANARQSELATTFAGLMLKAGYSVRTFNPAGQDDIGGGCGQLWFVQKWMRDNPGLARPSVGYGLAQVHTPRSV